jgi:hypothetical protein
MATQKTLPTQVSVEEFINKIEDETVRDDTRQLVKLMEDTTLQPATMWGGSIIGFGKYHYKYASGHEGDSCRVGFSPRKDKFSLYLSCNIQEYQDLLNKLGKHKAGKGCLYIKKMGDVDLSVLREMVSIAYKYSFSKSEAGA